MARRRRFRIAGLSQHVIQRGNNRIEIFRSDDDYEVLIALLREACAKSEMDINTYVLMRNHFHLLVTPRRATAVEEAMHDVAGRYAMYFNRRYQRTGSLFEGRYRATIIDTEVYWYTCMRYVELNPVRAGIVSTPQAYYWSSHAIHAFGAPDPLVTLHPLYLSLGTEPDERQRRWRQHCSRDLEVEELGRIREAVRGGVLGALVLGADEPAKSDKM
jgi:putative transposase